MMTQPGASQGTPESKDYEKWHERLEVDVESDAPWHRMLKARLGEKELAGKRILEIGCGRGGFACWLARQQHTPREVVAADFSAVAVKKGEEYARENDIERITWRVGDIMNIAESSESFDTVFSCETIEHVPDPKKAVSELARVLKPGGKLFLTTPNYMNTTGVYRGYRRLIGRPFTEEGQPINNFMLFPLTRRWVRATGLRVLESAGDGHYLPFPGRRPIRIRALDALPFVTRWTALSSMIMAEKPLA